MLTLEQIDEAAMLYFDQNDKGFDDFLDGFEKGATEANTAAGKDIFLLKAEIAELVSELKNLSYAAQTTGGTAGTDKGLMAAIADAEKLLKKYEK